MAGAGEPAIANALADSWTNLGADDRGAPSGELATDEYLAQVAADKPALMTMAATADDTEIPMAEAVVVAEEDSAAEQAAAATAAAAAQAAQEENLMLRQALEEQQAKLLQQAEALKSLGATPEPMSLITMPAPPSLPAATGKKRGRPVGSKNKPTPPKPGSEISVMAVAEGEEVEPPPKPKRGRPLGSKNKVCLSPRGSSHAPQPNARPRGGALTPCAPGSPQPKPPKDGVLAASALAVTVVAEALADPSLVTTDASVVDGAASLDGNKPKRGR